MRNSTANVPRRWWLAALLALAGRGVGQLYNGQPRKALAAFVLPVVLLFAANRAPVPALAQALLLAGAAAFAWSVVDAVAIAFAQRRAFVTHRFDRPLAWAGAVVAGRLIDTLVVGTLAVRIASVPEGGMHPAITSGDRVLLDLAAYTIDAPRRGDIVAFRSPVDDRSRRVSRIVGLPGETIELRDKQVLIDGRALRENWSVFTDDEVRWPTDPSPRDHYGPRRLPRDGYFVLDDDRDVGFDSRYWDRAVRRDQIEGRAAVYAFSRNPSAGVRWQRIGLPVHRDVRLPVDGPASLPAAMDAGPTLPASAAAILVLLAGVTALGAPLGETWWRQQRRRAAAAPYTVVPAAPACVSEAVRADRAAAIALEPPLARLGALADLLHRETNPRAARHPLDVPLADCLNEFVVARATPAELRLLLQRLDVFEHSGRLRDTAVRGLLHWRRAAAVQRLARLDDAPDLLPGAITSYRRALDATPAEHAPLRRAAIQNDLGTALQQFGESSGDDDLLDQAIGTYRLALRQRTERRAPLDWATTQHNLGNCLRLLGERSARTDHLQAAVAAYRAALTLRTRAADPVGHAMTLNNLGIALRLIGARAGDPGPILQAQHLHRESLALLTQFAPSFATVPAQNLEDDDDLLQRIGMRAAPLAPHASAMAA
jgi:signal peptidase I